MDGGDKDTRAVFGDRISLYDIQDAVDDCAAVPTRYESRLARLDIDQAQIEQLACAVEEVLDEVRQLPQGNFAAKLRGSATVDLRTRDSSRARLRNLMRVTLRRHKYPLDTQEGAIRLVLEQAERLADGWVDAKP